jgi:hypothetical protein
MEYIAAALAARGHEVTLVDLRFGRPVEHYLKAKPHLIGIAAMHALETENVLDLVGRIRRVSEEVPLVIGGHTAAAYPAPLPTQPSTRSGWTTGSASCLASLRRSNAAILGGRLPAARFPAPTARGYGRPQKTTPSCSTTSRCRRGGTSIAGADSMPASRIARPG